MKKMFAKNRNEAALLWLRDHEYQDAIDIGSRDGKLIKSVNAKNRYAIDLHNQVQQGGVQFLKHNLENGLPAKSEADPSFDLVVANDVIEHVENKSHLINQIFQRSRRHVVISLPNTQHYKYVVGLMRGQMSKQYVFMVPDNGDRHRWITYYKDNIRFVEGEAGLNGFSITRYAEVFRPHYLRHLSAVLPRSMTVFNQVFFCERTGG